MARTLVYGQFAHVVGTFELSPPNGTIDFVTPVQKATASLEGGDRRVRLVGQSANGQTVLDLAVNPQRNSAEPREDSGTYEEFVPVSADLRFLRLLVAGVAVAEYRRGDTGPWPVVAFGAPPDAAPHRLPLAAEDVSRAGITYAVQAKPDTAEQWQTLAVGLPTPSTDIDINQFPGSSRIDVRVLRSDGFAEEEVFRDTKTF